MISTEERLKKAALGAGCLFLALGAIYSTCSEQGFSLKSRRFSNKQ